MPHPLLLNQPAVTPPLDPGFRPFSLAMKQFDEAVRASGQAMPLRIALERSDGSISTFETEVFTPGHPLAVANAPYAERLVKFLLWQRGGYRVFVGGPDDVGEHITQRYAGGDPPSFDAAFMGPTVYGRRFEVIATDPAHVPDARERSEPAGRHLDGCRVGFDLGASDRKTSAVIDGEDVFSEETPWDPKASTDWRMQYEGIKHSIDRAREHLPRLDAIGASAAGVYVNNEVRAASLFRGIPPSDFDAHVRPLFQRLASEYGVPLVVMNDGEVTALAGSMSLDKPRVLGVAMGSSQAVGYVNAEGNLTGWLNELAFAPVDARPDGPEDEWSGDVGCGAQYFSQQAVMRLAPAAGLTFDDERSVPQRLEDVQRWMLEGRDGVRELYETIGVYLGYAAAQYATFYDVEHLLVLGRVTTGPGGDVILERARHVLQVEFPEVAERLNLMLPNEKLRRVGQAIAAASLPSLA